MARPRRTQAALLSATLESHSPARRPDVFGRVKEPSGQTAPKTPDSQEKVESRPPAEVPTFTFKFPGPQPSKSKDEGKEGKERKDEKEGKEKKQETVTSSQVFPSPHKAESAPSLPTTFKFEPRSTESTKVEPQKPTVSTVSTPADDAQADKDHVTADGITIIAHAGADFDPVTAGESGEKNLFNAKDVTYYVFDSEGKVWVKNYVGFIRVNRPLTDEEREEDEEEDLPVQTHPRLIFRRNGTFLLCINSALAADMAVKKPEGNSKMLEAVLANAVNPGQETEQEIVPRLYLFKFQTAEERDKCYEAMLEAVKAPEEAPEK